MTPPAKYEVQTLVPEAPSILNRRRWAAVITVIVAFVLAGAILGETGRRMIHQAATQGDPTGGLETAWLRLVWFATVLGMLGALSILWAVFTQRTQSSSVATLKTSVRRARESARTVEQQLEDALEALEMRDLQEDQALALAREIQEGFLPQAYPFAGVMRFAGLYDACESIGGDLYDVRAIGERFACVSIADVSGHGVSAALVTAIFKLQLEHHMSVSRLATGDRVPTPEDLAKLGADLNDSLSGMLQRGLFVTMLLGLVDVRSGETLLLNAGHNRPVHYRAREHSADEVVLPANIPLGLMEGFAFEVATLRLEKGDKLVLYTDGLTERMDRLQREFGVHGFLQAVRANGHLAPEKLAGAVRLAVEAHGAQAAAHDDQTMLVVERVDPDKSDG